MKTLVSLVLSAFLAFAMAPQALAHQHGHGEHKAQDYACPMHPEVQGVKGDSCPKCGMDLEKVAADTKQKNCPHAKAAEHKNCPHANNGEHKNCPHAKATEHKCDNCPKDKHHHAQAKYDCPMHPEVTGKKGDTCPKCGMNLEPVKTANAHQHKHH
ncbi:heavy metal-binding domain-containing protein [Shewanella waksmanii]|uniref:heavy metal-binding domain-containing protein n=1 Tax=Shewanella waksmanii TaxID=213783 RepID=UPI0037364624